MDKHKGEFSQIFIITDQIPVKKKKKDIEKAIKLYLSRWSEVTKVPYKIFHYSSKSDINLQIVDYFNWAIFRKWESADTSNYNLIKDAVSSEFDIFYDRDNILKWLLLNKYFVNENTALPDFLQYMPLNY